MAEALHLFHTADIHVARFDALRDRIASGYRLIHHTRPDWLMRAQNEGLETGLRDEVLAAIRAVPGPVLCTCTTLGEVASEAGALRIDQPMMRAAAMMGGRICLAYCLASTAETSAALLARSIAEAGAAARIDRLELAGAWRHFEAGDAAAFAETVAAGIRGHLARHADTCCVVLAQASMEGAAEMLSDTGVRVFSSPELALRQALRLGHQPDGNVRP